MKPAHKLLFENNLHESHWGLRIIEAEIVGAFTKQDRKDSSKWMSCACGTLDSHIKPRKVRKTGILVENRDAPDDDILYSLGCEFPVHVINSGNFCLEEQKYNPCLDAAAVLIKIEARSMVLYQESLK